MAVFSLTGQRVLVLGGSSGIGFGAARLAVELGAEVTIASRNVTRLMAARASLGAVKTATIDLTIHPERGSVLRGACAIRSCRRHSRRA